MNAVTLAYGLHKGGSQGGREAMDNLWRRISDAGKQYSPLGVNPIPLTKSQASLVNAFSYQMFDAMTRSFSPSQFNPYDINPLRDILDSCIDFESLRGCKAVQLYVSATNVRSGKVHVFETTEMTAEVVSASTCLPHLFKAVEIDGEHYWDGGFMGNPVLFPLFYEAESSDIIIVHVNPIERDDVPSTAPEIMNRVNEITFNSSLLRELRAISFIHKLLDDGWIKDEYHDRLRNIHIHSVRSDRALAEYSTASKFRTDWRFLCDLKEQGRLTAKAWLDENFDLIGNQSSVNLREMFDQKES